MGGKMLGDGLLEGVTVATAFAPDASLDCRLND